MPGFSAVVLYSLFEEQIEQERAAHEHFEQVGTESHAEALTYLPNLDYFPRGPEGVRHPRGQGEAGGGHLPVIASLNGTTRGGWVKYARMLQDAGADALELNIYHVASDPTVNAASVEARYLGVVAAVKEHVTIPVAVKLSPFFSSLAHLRPTPGRNRRRRARALQSLLSAGHQPGRAGGSGGPGAERPARVAPAAALDCHSGSAGQGFHRRHQRGCIAVRMRSSCCWLGRTR